MASTKDSPQRAFIAGYQDISPEDFATHYHHHLDKAIERGDTFLLSAEPGACEMAAEYLKSNKVPQDRITEYHSAPVGGDSNERLRLLTGHFKDRKVRTIGGGESERLATMLKNSDYQILWVRPGDSVHDERLSAAGVLDARYSGPKEVTRLRSQVGILRFMEEYDKVV